MIENDSAEKVTVISRFLGFRRNRCALRWQRIHRRCNKRLDRDNRRSQSANHSV